MKFTLSFMCLLLCSCGKIREWRLQRAIETWDRRVAEYRMKWGEWTVMAPGAPCEIYPTGGRVDSPMVKEAYLLLTDVLMAEWVLRSQLPEVDRHISWPLPPVRLKLHGYLRQYKGYYDREGKLHVLVNAIWNQEPKLKGFTRVKDGGNHYWQIWIDVNGLRLYNLAVNGEA